MAIADMPPDVDAPPGDLFVFGYGSLMWRPGFDVVAAHPARLSGYHRAFCMSSIHYRGTKAHPGLVLGLARGGSCLGRAMRVAADKRLSTIAYLRERELISYVYREVIVPIQLTETGQRVLALTYVADEENPQFERDLNFEAQAQRIASAHGSSGSNVDYLRQTIAEMDQLGLKSGALHALLTRVEQILA
jgi:cation transport protein ChaC